MQKWKKIEIVFQGITPLLMHSAAGMVLQTIKKNPAKQYNIKEDAENASYRTKDGYLCVPSRCIKAAILNAASWYKFGKQSAKPIIAGCTRVEPVEIVITDLKNKKLKNYEIDLRPVVVQRARVMRARPRLDEWQLRFELVYNSELIQDTEILRTIIEEAGQRIGLLDNRPQKYGENGTFSVIKWLVK